MDLLDRFLAQINAIPGVWMPFVIALAIIGLIMWKMIQWQYSVRIENLNSRLDLYRETSAVSANTAAQSVAAAETAQLAAPAPGLEVFAPPPPTADKEQREFVSDEFTVESLRGLFLEGHSTLQAQLAARPYIGKWFRLRGEVANAMLTMGMITVTLKASDRNSTFPVVNLNYGAPNDRLVKLNAGDPIEAIGRLFSAEPTSIYFIECEFVD